MRRDVILRQLRSQSDRLHALGVVELSLFGSVARDAATDKSDVDLLVTFSPGPFWSRYNQVLDLLEEMLQCRVDLVPKEDLKPLLRARVEAEALRVA